MPYVDRERKRIYDQQWNRAFYLKNRAQEIARVAKRKTELRAWLDGYKSNLACEKCGERHIACLDFHHRNGKTKDFTIGNIKQRGWGKERVLNEIKKCMVICANCHRKLHARMVRK